MDKFNLREFLEENKTPNFIPLEQKVEDYIDEYYDDKDALRSLVQELRDLAKGIEENDL